MTTHFSWVDGTIIFTYLASLAGIGAYFSRRQRNLEDFFLAGRSMGWLPIGLSLMAALNSGIDYVAVPGTTLKYGLIFLVCILSWLFLYPWVAWVMLPFYRRLNVYSVYEYLEKRFDLTVRTLAATIFILWRLGWMATALYVPCLAINAVTAGKLPLTPLILVLGFVVSLYTMLGGIRAIIWTEVLQFCVMFLGLSITVGLVVAHVPGGLPAIWEIAQTQGKTRIFGDLPRLDGVGMFEQVRRFFADPNTFTGILVACVVGRLSMYTNDQVMMQRLQTTRSLAAARGAFVINAAGDAAWTASLTLVGLSLLAYYSSHVLPSHLWSNTDQIFPYFMSTVFPPGVTGVVIAAILGASLSSIASAINSCTSVVMVDFYNRLIVGRSIEADRLSDTQQASQVRISRMVTIGFGAIGTLLATLVPGLGMIVKIANSVVQTFTGPLLGIYLLGMFSERARSLGALLGGIVGTIVSLYVAFCTEVGFVWPTVFGLTATWMAGQVVSRLLPGTASPEARQFTWRNIMRAPLRPTGREQ